ncbi:pyridoxal-phosphate dependent enzyme [Myroides marinus]|uniref:1-aminocyclopropane-1-carboxylate deaminase/D-cysteine desulfhydrase n=1 Tax=Myroides marinus TaxID=703342 RepID=UPI00257510D1|nr:pyridoxal-phosphate dependent enzyme [Myroides marinus]MDM1405482.1 pyridoxal-phosphate dependent enzyme [Myroides marinus]
MKNFNLISTIEKDKFLVFRDDVYPFLGGGNKGRKMEYIGQDIFKKEAKSIVTTGGIQSNHCRAVAVFAAMNKLECTLVLHGDKNDFNSQGGNAKIMRDSGCKVVFAEESSRIGALMDKAIEEYENKSLNPYYIWGGGHTLEGGLAYIDAIGDLKDYCQTNNWYPEYIFHASGTGSTQSGIMAGLDKYSFIDTKVIGISVGRKSEQATIVVDNFYKELCQHYQINCLERETVVLDDYLYGGYGMSNDEVKSISKNSLKDFGFTLDTCYTAKAFYGMQDFLKQNNLNDKNVLFWHTGGVFNYLAE